MTEFLLRVHDKVHLHDPFLTDRLTKRGDFISVAPSGHEWGTGEASAPYWRILASDIPDAEGLPWLAEENLVENGAVRDRVWKRKIMRFRCDLAAGDFATWLANDLRPSGNVPDRIVSGEHDVAVRNDQGKSVLVRAKYSYRVPMWFLPAATLRTLVERKPEGPARPMIAGSGYVVRAS